MKKTGFPAYILLFIISFVFASGSKAEDIQTSAGAFVDKSYVKIGQPVKYTVRSIYPHGSSAEFPEFLNKIGDFEIVSVKHKSEKMKTADFMQDEYEYVLSGYNIGGYILDPAEVKIIFPGGDQKIYKTEEIYVEVKSVLDEQPGDIKDIKGVFTAPSFAVYLITIAVIVVFMFSAFILLMKSGKKRFSLFRETYLSPHERAFNAFSDLKKSDLINKGLIKMFYFRLSAIIRRYIEDRFGLRAPERTTEEFLQEISDSDVFNDERREFLKRFLRQCDKVKFANYMPSGEDMVSSFEDSVRFVDGTKQSENTEIRK